MKTILLVFVFLFSNLLLIAQDSLKYASPPDPASIVSQDPTYENVATPEEILVVYKNSVGNNDTSESIKDYYVSKRNIPAINILPLEIPDTITYQAGLATLHQGGEDIWGDSVLGWWYVRDTIATPIERYLNNTYVSGHPLSERIRYIVLCKGIPLKIRSLPYVQNIRSRRQTSVSSLLCLINQPNPSKNFTQLYNTDVTTQHDPLFQVDPTITMDYRFKSNHFVNNDGWYMQYLVTWLNGDDYNDVVAQIDRFADPDLSGVETWVIDDDPDPYYHNFQFVHQKLHNLGFNLNPEIYVNSQDWIVSNDDPVIGYVSHGVHAGMPANYILNNLDFFYANGSNFLSWESFNAWSFGVLTSMQIGQGQIADFIHMGGSGGSGHVYEPYTDGVTQEYNTFPSYRVGS